ncbi:MAG: hypothetical protein HKO82_08955 [Acidimicrobiia bacterium]|nr:hypothetical protein [Acidimicrobiia bacterium]NNL13799.1 hypothetical protein [Acidimicrobiia bacterium]
MTTDLKTQIQAYFDDIDPPFEPDELMAHPAAGRISDGRVNRLRWRRYPGWAYAAATAALVLLVVAGAVWLTGFRGEETPPVITQPPAPITTVTTYGPLPEAVTVDPEQIGVVMTGDEASGIAVAGGAMWVSTELGVVRWNLEDRSGELFAAGDGLPFSEGESGDVAVAPNGTVWAYSWNQDLAYFDGTGWSEPDGYDERCLSLEACSGPITAMAVLPDNSLSLAVGPEMLLEYDGTDWDVVTVTPSEIHGGNAWATDMAVAPDGTLWVASWEELLSFDGEVWSRFTAVDGLPSGRINSVAAAPNGDVWVGTQNSLRGDPSGGVGRYDGTSWTVFDESSGLHSNAVTALAVGPDGTAWAVHGDTGEAGPVASGFSRFDGTTWEPTTVGDVGLGFGWGGAVVDDTGTLWITSRYGAFGFDGTEVTVLRFPAGARSSINQLPYPLPSQILPNGQGPLEWHWVPLLTSKATGAQLPVTGTDCFGSGSGQLSSTVVEFRGSSIDFSLGYRSTPDVVVTDPTGTGFGVENPFGEQAWVCSVAATETHLLAVGSAVSWSVDGINWHGIEVFDDLAGGNSDGSDLIWAAAGPGGYIVLGRSGSLQRLAWFSEDLQIWYEIPFEDGPDDSEWWGLVGPYGLAVEDEPVIVIYDGAWVGTRLEG